MCFGEGNPEEMMARSAVRLPGLKVLKYHAQMNQGYGIMKYSNADFIAAQTPLPWLFLTGQNLGLHGILGQTNYSAAKGGMIAATKALAQEVARKKVTVNCVAPGFIRTDMVEGLDEAALKKDIPAARFGEPEEVAALVGFFASADAAYINGETISVNGGLYT